MKKSIKLSGMCPLIVLIVCLLQLASCKKYLEEKSNKALVVPTTIIDFQRLLDDAVYMNLATPSFLESSADDYFLTDVVYNGRPERQRNVYTWTPNDEYYIENDWSLCYKAIYNSNVCIEGIQKITRTDQNMVEWDNIMGSALFFRAYHFLNLSWTYSKSYNKATEENDLGIVLRLTSDFNIPSSRANVKESYARIILDTKVAASLLKDHPEHVMRPSRASAFALLARTYLSMNEYDSAYKYSNLCLGIKSDLLDYNSISSADPVPFSPFNKEIIFFSSMNSSLTLHGPTRGNIDTSLYNSYDINDIRKNAFFLSAAGYRRFKGSYASDAYILFTGLATDEMYLIRAECRIRLNDIMGGIDDLNKIALHRRASNTFGGFTVSTRDEALSLCLLERRKELLLRGIRWSDIKRLNIQVPSIVLKRVIANQVFELPPNDRRFALPLPRDIIQYSAIQQN